MSKTFTTRNIVYIALLVALLSVSAYINIPTPIDVPFTLQVLIVFVIACLLEKKLAALAVGLYVALGLLGVPVFAGGNGGFSYIFRPTFGYLIGFIIAAFVMSAIYASPKIKKKLSAYILGGIVAILIIYATGMTYFFLIKLLYTKEAVSFVPVFFALTFPYIILDIVKCIAAYGIIIALEKATGKSQRPS